MFVCYKGKTFLFFRLSVRVFYCCYVCLQSLGSHTTELVLVKLKKQI